MAESRLLKKIAEKESDKDAIAEKVIVKPALLKDVYDGLGAKAVRIKYGCAKVLRIISDAKPELLYPRFDFFAELLAAPNQMLYTGTIMSKSVLTCLFICSLHFWSGCAGTSVKDKERSVASVGEFKIAGVPVKAYIGKRTGLLLKDVQMENTEIHSDKLTTTHGGQGLACAVSEDGYFLTAFHVVQDAEHLHLWAGQDRGNLFPATVIWSSEEHDLAVLRSAVRATPFPISIDVKKDSVCFCGGVDGGHSTGKILETSNGEDFGQVLHSAPAVPGDSGGPLILQDGYLAGINISVNKKTAIPIWGLGLLGVRVSKCSEAVQINPRFIEEIISKDRNRNGSASSIQLGSNPIPARKGGP